MTNEEKAREYLLKEHLSPLNKILHLCDLNTELQYHKDIENAFIKGAEWKDEQTKRQFIDKAVRWLKDNALHYCYKSSFTGDAMIDINRLVERFEIAMQEE